MRGGNKTNRGIRKKIMQKGDMGRKSHLQKQGEGGGIEKLHVILRKRKRPCRWRGCGFCSMEKNYHYPSLEKGGGGEGKDYRCEGRRKRGGKGRSSMSSREGGQGKSTAGNRND